MQLFFARLINFLFLFFSASALFTPFSTFFLSEAFFYYLLYWETPQWDVSTVCMEKACIGEMKKGATPNEVAPFNKIRC